MLTAELIDLHHVDEAVHLVLYHVKADVAVQLREQILHLLRRRQLLLGLRLLLAGGYGGLLFALSAGGRFGRGRGLGCGRGAPEVAVHPLDAVFRHGADHIQLLQDDLILLIHSVTS